MVEDISTAYMAPEAFHEQTEAAGHLDIFSLGAIAYHVFSNQPPAQSGLDLVEKLRSTNGLQISSVLNGAGEWLHELVRAATDPNVANRTDNMHDFIGELDQVYTELVMIDEDIVEDPLHAHPGAKLPEGITVIKELGTGASSKAFLVSVEDKEAVLKVAASHEHNERLRNEGEVLEKLHQHQHIVKHFRTLEIGGRVCLLLSRAGTETLGDRLTKAGRLHAGLLSRFGEDLLDVVRLPGRTGNPASRHQAPQHRGRQSRPW